MQPLAARMASLVNATPATSSSSPIAPADPAGLARIAAEADPFGRLVLVDELLVRAGFPAMSAWWKHDLEKFYASGKRWHVVLCGRGGGKSTTLTRVAVCEGLFAGRSIPPGQRWIWPFISASTADARRRIMEIVAALRALGIEAEPTFPQNHPTVETLDVHGNPIGYVALASTIAAVSGPSAIGATVDEEQKLKDRNTLANPAREILASLIQTFRARPGIRAIRCSSAWTDEGTHAAAIRDGDTEASHVGRIGAPFLAAALDGFVAVAEWERAHGDSAAAKRILDYAETLTAMSPAVPTWLANPTIGAVASRLEVQALPVSALDGLSRSAYWCRENGSVLPGAKEDRALAEAAARRRIWEGLDEMRARMPRPAFSGNRV